MINNQLILKDFRLLRPILVLGIALGLAPYGILAIGKATGIARKSWPAVLSDAGLTSAALTLLTAVSLGGNSFALERRDGSLQFLTSLPPARRDVVFSKLIVSLGLLVCIWLIDAAVLRLGGLSQGSPFAPTSDHGMAGYSICVASGWMCFGVSFLLSTRARDPMQASIGGILGPFCLTALVNLYGSSGALDGATALAVYLACSVVLGLIAIYLGVRSFVRSRED